MKDITADSFCRWREHPVAGRGNAGAVGPRTLNQYREAARGLCQWLVRRQRVAKNPLQNIDKIDETSDVRRARRALSADQIADLLPVVDDRHRLAYLILLTTGLRRQEAADLRWGDIRLDSPSPFIQLRAKATKSRRADALPLRVGLAEVLRRTRGEAGDADAVVSAMPSMKDHKAYLERAGIDFEDSEGRRLDIHALRHSFGTLLSKSGVLPREAMSLMRHSDLRLTMKTYTDPRLFDLAGAVEKLPMPSMEREAAAATGTDGAAANEGVGEPASGPAMKSAITCAITCAIKSAIKSAITSSACIGGVRVVIGNSDGNGGSSITPCNGGNWQQKNSCGEGRVEAPRTQPCSNASGLYCPRRLEAIFFKPSL